MEAVERIGKKKIAYTDWSTIHLYIFPTSLFERNSEFAVQYNNHYYVAKIFMDLVLFDLVHDNRATFEKRVSHPMFIINYWANTQPNLSSTILDLLFFK